MTSATAFNVGDTVMIVREIARYSYYNDENGQRIWIPEEMVADMEGVVTKIRGVHHLATTICYLLECDTSGANGGSGWHWPASLLELVAEDVELVDIQPDALYSVLV